MSVKRNQNGREIKKGIVFGYLCSGKGGHAHDNKVYRFGRSSKIDYATVEHLDVDVKTIVLIDRLGQAFSGLNRPQKVILWAPVSDMHRAWDIVREYLREDCFVQTSKTERPIIVQEYQLGDNFFSLGSKATPSEFGEHLEEAFGQLLEQVEYEKI